MVSFHWFMNHWKCTRYIVSLTKLDRLGDHCNFHRYHQSSEREAGPVSCLESTDRFWPIAVGYFVSLRVLFLPVAMSCSVRYSVSIFNIYYLLCKFLCQAIVYRVIKLYQICIVFRISKSGNYLVVLPVQQYKNCIRSSVRTVCQGYVKN